MENSRRNPLEAQVLRYPDILQLDIVDERPGVDADQPGHPREHQVSELEQALERHRSHVAQLVTAQVQSAQFGELGELLRGDLRQVIERQIQGRQIPKRVEGRLMDITDDVVS